MALQHIVSGALLMTAGGALADACCCTPTPPPVDCTWYLSPDTLIFDCNVQSGAFNINVPTGSNCGWSASVTSGGAYLTITAGGSGNTDGTVDFDLVANPNPQRTAQITVVTTVVSNLGPIGTVIGTFNLTQSECATSPGGFVPGGGGGSPPAPGSTCSWSVSPTGFLLSCFPQGGFFNVNTQLGCGWEAVVISGGAFITITSGTPGNDAGSVFFSISSNGGVARGGQIEVRTTVLSSYGPIGTVVGIVNLSQNVCPGGGGGSPCAWAVSPSSLYAGTACDDGQSLQTTVFTYLACSWQAISQDVWITITSGGTGLSTGNIVFDVDANTTGLERKGHIFVYTNTASVLGPIGTKIGTITVIEPDCVSLLLEPAMRAANERRARKDVAPTTGYTNRRFDINGLIAGPGESPATQPGTNFYAGSGNVYEMPVDYFYYYDLLHYDAHFVQPAGTRAAQLVNLIRDNINDNALLGLYVDNSVPIQNAASITFYNTGTLPVPAAATTVDYEARLIDLRNAIRKLLFVEITATSGQIIANSKGVRTQGEGSIAAAKACVSANYAGTSYGTYRDYLTGCVFSGTTANSLMTAGAEVFVDIGFDGWMSTSRLTYSATPAPYLSVLSGRWYFKTSAGTFGGYFAPTAYGSPPFQTLALMATSTASSGALNASDVEVDLPAMLASAVGAPNDFGWYLDSFGSMVLELGFTTII